MLIRLLSVITFFLITLSSCVTIYFDRPQPVDAKDLKKAPQYMRGTWVMDMDTARIDRHSFYWVEWYLDTISNYEVEADDMVEVRDGFIYDLSEEPLVGYECKPLGDEWVVYFPDRVHYELSDTTLLRKVSRNFYTFNLTKDRTWWEVFLVEKAGKGSLSIWYPGRTDVCLMEAIGAGEEQYLPEDDDPDTAFTNDFQKYWLVELTRKRLLECYDLGAFGELILELNNGKKK